MKLVTTITTLLAVASTAFAADPPLSKSLDPSQFIGKTFEECEKVLGKPTETKE